MPHAPGHWGYEDPGEEAYQTKAELAANLPSRDNTQISMVDRFTNPLYGSSILGSYGRAMATGRAGEGGTGGGSMVTEGNMDPNLLIGLNPYLDENVTSFSHGGKHKTPKYNYGGVTHTMPDGTVHPGATHEEYMDMMNKYKHGGEYKYDNGGISPSKADIMNRLQLPNTYGTMSPKALSPIQMALRAKQEGQYEQQANQMIALGQLSNVFKGLQQRAMLNTQVQSPYNQANKGMKMRKRYTQGGRF